MPGQAPAVDPEALRAEARRVVRDMRARLAKLDDASLDLILNKARSHYAWDNSLQPRLTIDSGDTVVFQTRDAADGYYSFREAGRLDDAGMRAAEESVEAGRG